MSPPSRTTEKDTVAKAIEIESLTLKGGDSILFSDLDLSLEPGEKAAVTAPSGFGKSTLLRCLLGLVPATAGTVCIFGTELTPRSAWQLRCCMAYVDQEPDLGEDTLEAALSLPFSYKNNQHLQLDCDRMASLMEQLQLPRSLLSKQTSSLSGGERQRAALVGALLLERDILLLDEPTSALDQETGAAVAELLQEKEELTVLAVSHDPQLTDSFDRVIDLKQHSRRAV